MGILLDVAYGAGMIALSPMIAWRMIRHGRYREDVGQRFGSAPLRHGLQPTIWVHGVSLGEINAARTLVDELHSQLPDYRVVVSTTTETGMEAARKHFAEDHLVFRWPLDFTVSVGRALDRIRPAMVVTLEGEVWPNFLAACNKRNVPAVVVNARISRDKGYPRYKKLGPLARRLFNRLTAIGCQTEGYAELFAKLGVDESKLHVTGMLKFDTAVVADRIDGQDELAAAVGITEKDALIVAGGTGPDEERRLLDVYRKVKEAHADAKLAIVPRKPERFDEVARIIADAGFHLIRRSEHPDRSTPESSDEAVILGDTMGELRKFYSLSTVAFVGRSLVPMGGSDMIEAAGLGKPTCFGPHTFNFPQADEMTEHGCVRVADADELAALLTRWLAEPDKAAAAGREARDFVADRKGATKRNVAMICRILDRVPAVRDGSIATDRIVNESTPTQAD
ncbi:MAG: 3-deoxy-D-manno-octulosonic acid transferase [Phycisphaerae bacterium]